MAISKVNGKEVRIFEGYTSRGDVADGAITYSFNPEYQVIALQVLIYSQWRSVDYAQSQDGTTVFHLNMPEAYRSKPARIIGMHQG